jgi:hypothetical protein
MVKKLLQKVARRPLRRGEVLDLLAVVIGDLRRE